MTASRRSLHAVPDPLTCRSPGCVAPSRGRCELCGSCELVYRAAIALYHALCARELSRMDAAAPGIGEIAGRVLVQRLRELAPGRDLADAALLCEAEPVEGRPLVGWQLARLEAFLDELRASAREAGAPR